MQRIKLGEVCDISSSKRIFEKEYVPKGIPFIRGLEISNGAISKEEYNFDCYISHDRYEELKRTSGVPSRNDILITAVGTIGNLYLVDNDKPFYFKDGNILWFHNYKDCVDPLYLKYYMQSPFFDKQLERAMIGAVQKALTIVMLNNVVIDLPDIRYQNEVARILGAIDSKITVNNKIIETSEKLMREIYDYWFVQFDFPDENGRPFKSSGGEMVYDEKLKREIPKEWKAIDLSNLVKNRTEATIGTHDDKCIDLSIMPSDNIVLDKYNFGDSFSSNMKTMKKGDILFGSIRPYLRKAGIAPYDGVRAGTVHCFYAKNTIDSSMCSVMMTSEDMFQYAIMKSGGSTRMPSVSAKDILSYSFAYNQEISSKYNDICSDLINQIILLINENISLAYLRDWLLPMLMNGQVKIEDK